MAEDNDRVQEALAAYFDHLEIGGPRPDFSHLSADEARELQELIDDLELTEGVAFGSGREEAAAAVQVAATAAGERLLEELRSSLPPGVRIDADDNRYITHIGGLEVVDRAILGTFGGRVRIWLLDVDTAETIEANVRTLADVAGVFGMFPDMSAVALVGRDLSCVIVEPQDTSPQIQVPSGSLIARRYKRAIQPAVEAIPAFLDELIPYWDPMPAFDPSSGIAIDIADLSEERVTAAVGRQRKIGERARKGNPKKEALLALGDKETAALRTLTKGLFDGSIDPSDIEARISKAAGR